MNRWTGLQVALLAAPLAVMPACGGASAPPGAGAGTTRETAVPGVVTLDAAALASGGITLVTVEAVTSTGQVQVPGVVALDDTRTARIGSLQEGLVLKTLAQAGDRVAEGQLLATMHGHAMHDAWAGYRKAVAARQRAEAEVAYATDAHARSERLLVAKAIAAQDVRRAELDRVTAVEHLADARAEITRSIEELEHVGVHVTAQPNGEVGVREADADEPIPVRSPMGGVVLERLVTPGTTVVPGTTLYTVSDLSRLWVVAEVDETLLPRVVVGRPVDVRVTAWPDEVFRGTVTFVGDVVHPVTRRVTVRASLANSDRRLKPDMYATVGLGVEQPRPAVLVPRTAIQSVEGHPTVFVAAGTGRFVPRTVTLGVDRDARVEITAGVTAGEQVAATGGFALKSALAGPPAGAE